MEKEENTEIKERKYNYTIIGKPWKAYPWQVTKYKSDNGMILIQIKKFFIFPNGSYNFKKYWVVWCKQTEWESFKKEIKYSMRK